MSEADKFSDQAVAAVEAAVRQAFEAGRALGRREAAGMLRERLMRAVDFEEEEGALSAVSAVAGAAAVKSDRPGRAPTGSVKPVLLRLIQASGTEGLTLAEIQERASDVNPNSIRGTLHSLREEQNIKRIGDRYFPVRHSNEAADTKPIEAESAASITGGPPEGLPAFLQSPAQGREAGPGGGG